MLTVFVIEDEFHAEIQGEYATLAEAISELKRRMNIPWNQEPNRCPCTSWETCGRHYQIIKYDTSSKPWKEINRKTVLNISSKETQWLLKNG